MSIWLILNASRYFMKHPTMFPVGRWQVSCISHTREILVTCVCVGKIVNLQDCAKQVESLPVAVTSKDKQMDIKTYQKLVRQVSRFYCRIYILILLGRGRVEAPCQESFMVEEIWVSIWWYSKRASG